MDKKINTMKLTGLLFVVLICTVVACRKETVKNYAIINGDYNWELTYYKDFTTVYNSEIEPNFGIRIKKNNRVELYENGEVILKGEIIQINEISSDQLHLTVNFGQVSHDFVYLNKELKSASYPFNAEFNVFTKK